MKNNNHIYFTRQERRSLIVFFLMATLFISMMYSIYRFEKEQIVPVEVALSQSAEAKMTHKKIQAQLFKVKRKDKTRTTRFSFRFNPNTISEDSLKLLGLDARTIQTFVKYRKKSTGFKSKDQFFKIFGMKNYQEQLDSLIVFDEEGIHNEKSRFLTNGDQNNISSKTIPDANPIPTIKIKTININTADSFEWQLVKGIGQKLAGRIVRYRERLGGFVRVEQIEEVYGIKPETYMNISHLLTVDPGLVKKIAINVCTEKELVSHPYIGRKKGTILIRYINNKGFLQSVSDLVATKMFDEEELNKIEPYLDFRIE